MPDIHKRLKKIGFGAARGSCYVSLALSLISLLAIIIFVFVRGGGSLSFQLLFGTYSSAHPSILPAFLGTIYLILISLLIAFPLGLFTAIFLSEYTVNDSLPIRIIRVSIETLAGIPSIVYGLFGYLLFVTNWGYSLLGGGLTLAIMILPLIVRNTEEALLSVPTSLREGSYALGSGKVRTIFRIVLPAASDGILTSLILAVGRVVSESAVLLLTVGMVVNLVPTSLMSAGTSLALDIYYFSYMGYTEEASATSLVLIILVLLLNGLAYLSSYLFARKKGNYGR